MLIVSCNRIGWEPASHCETASDGGQEKEEDPLLTEEVRETTEGEREKMKEYEREKTGARRLIRQAEGFLVKCCRVCICMCV